MIRCCRNEKGFPKMKFVVKSLEHLDSTKPPRAYNCYQTPEVGCEYDLTANGWVVGMHARVVVDDGGGWLWYPVESSYSSYYFREIPWRITVKTIDVSENMSKMFARWSNVARPKLLPKETIERPDIGVDRAIASLKSAGF